MYMYTYQLAVKTRKVSELYIFLTFFSVNELMSIYCTSSEDGFYSKTL